MYNIGTHSSCKMRMKEDDNELSNDVAENTQVQLFMWKKKEVELRPLRIKVALAHIQPTSIQRSLILLRSKQMRDPANEVQR